MQFKYESIENMISVRSRKETQLDLIIFWNIDGRLFRFCPVRQKNPCEICNICWESSMFVGLLFKIYTLAYGLYCKMYL